MNDLFDCRVGVKSWLIWKIVEFKQIFFFWGGGGLFEFPAIYFTWDEHTNVSVPLFYDTMLISKTTLFQ